LARDCEESSTSLRGATWLKQPRFAQLAEKDFLRREPWRDRLKTVKGRKVWPEAVSMCCIGPCASSARCQAPRDLLIVALDQDDTVRLSKGAARPYLPLEERLEHYGGIGLCLIFVTWQIEAEWPRWIQAFSTSPSMSKGTDWARPYS